MFRLSVLLLIMILLAACKPHKKQPVLSGVLWGGEGNRMVIRSAFEPDRVNDTLLIDHQGAFIWNPDTIIPGFYFLEKNPDNHLVLVFTNNEPVQVDAQYINFPQNAQVKGSEDSEIFFKVETLSKSWHKELEKVSSATSNSGWIPSPAAVKNIKWQLDSITNIYQEDILDVAGPPLVRMYALLQTAGHRQLFDPWKHRQLFFAVDTLLTPYRFIKEISHFSEKVDRLKATVHLAHKLQPGQSFPDMVLAYDKADTITVADLRQSPVYIGIHNPSVQDDQDMYQESLKQLNKYQWRGLEVAFLIPDSASIAKESPRFYYHNYTSGLPLNLQEELGIVILPANFILNEAGIIVAKNVWGDNLQQILEQLHQK